MAPSLRSGRKIKEATPRLNKVVCVLHENRHGELGFYLIPERTWKRRSFQIELHRAYGGEEPCGGGDECPYGVCVSDGESGTGSEATLERYADRIDVIHDRTIDISGCSIVVGFSHIAEQL